MRLIIIVILMLLLTSCGHMKWYYKNQNELCSHCPDKVQNTEHITDTTYWAIVPADTVYIEGLDFPDSNASVDNTNYQVIRKGNKTVVITKEKRVPVFVPKYKYLNYNTQSIEVVKYKVPFWFWGYCLLAFVIGFILSRLLKFFRL